MDTDRWLLEMIEFDRAVQVAKDFAATHPDTLVIVTADHECSGAAIIGASTRSVVEMRRYRAASGKACATSRSAFIRRRASPSTASRPTVTRKAPTWTTRC
ncbi:alkaline phosphatase [Roseateles sp. GG27B]